MGAFDLSSYLWPEATQNRQPQGAVGIASEFSEGCLAAYPVLGVGRESADGGKILAGIANPIQYVPVIGRAGLALSGDGAANAIAKGLFTQAGAVPYHGLPALSYFAVFELTAVSSGLESAIFRATGTNVSQGFALGVFPSTKKIRALIQTAGTTGWSASYDVTDSRMAAGVLWGVGVSYISGRRVIYSGPIGGAVVATVTTSITGAISDSAATSGPVYFGGSWYTGGTTPSFPGKIYTAAFWRGAKTRSEFESLFANPWQIFAPQPIQFSASDIPASTDLNASAIGHATSSGTASAQADVAIAAVGLALASGSASASIAIPLSATGIAVSSGNANAQATVTVSAAALAQAAGAAGISASVLLAAAGVAQTSGNATLAAQLNTLAAGAAQTSGTVDNAVNANAGASGSAQASGSAGATLAAQNEASANGYGTTDGSATIRINIQLAAAGLAATGGSATAQITSATTASASGNASASASATWSTLVTLSAAGFVSAMGAGVFSVDIPLSATGHATTSGSANASVLGAPTDDHYIKLTSSAQRLTRLRSVAERAVQLRTGARHVV